MIEITYYSKEWEQQHILFASKYWTKKRRIDPEYIYWKFQGEEQKKLKSFILAVDNGEVIGQLGLIPCRLKVDDKIFNAQWACDLMVDLEYRGKNVAKLLYEFAHTVNEITLGSDPSIAASRSMKKNGYHAFKGPWKHLFPIRLGEVSKLKGLNLKFLNFIPNPFLLFFFIFTKFENSTFSKNTIDEYKSLNNFSDDENSLKIVRDSAFVKWRFTSFLNYYPGIEIFSNSDKKIFFSGYYNVNSYYITDYSAKSTFHLIQILANIINSYGKLGLRRIRFCCNQDHISKHLVFFGIIKFRKRTEVVYFTQNSKIEKMVQNKKFYYTFMDSDENI